MTSPRRGGASGATDRPGPSGHGGQPGGGRREESKKHKVELPKKKKKIIFWPGCPGRHGRRHLWNVGDMEGWFVGWEQANLELAIARTPRPGSTGERWCACDQVLSHHIEEAGTAHVCCTNMRAHSDAAALSCSWVGPGLARRGRLILGPLPSAGSKPCLRHI